MISIALAAYNGEHFIKDQLESILNQTIQDFEIVVCDDNSNDSTWKILQEFQSRDNRIRVFQNPKNLGFKKNFEIAIQLCEGEYIALCDQDDIWVSNHLEVLHTSIGTKDASIGNALFVDKNLQSLGVTHIESLNGMTKYLDSDIGKAIRVLFVGNFCQGASMMFKANFLKSIYQVPDVFEVHDVWYAMAAICKKSLVFSPVIITYYRQHDSNVIDRTGKGIEKRLRGLFGRQSDAKLHQISYAVNNLSFDEDITNLIYEAILFHKNKRRFLFRLRFLKTWFAYFNYMYLNNKNRFFKTLLFLLFGRS
ncbi:glycosyltransferase [Alkaliflexus imshenetskii]|uniref:glycosyltransferase n=1 Tax=Alkaliflexus imshenetskii TaxID=286730 RepID=UPI0004BB276E|nr:glycosyltransferase [Alkaliflexus imshenetskii]